MLKSSAVISSRIATMKEKENTVSTISLKEVSSYKNSS